jgi:hypothetical protein
VTTIINNVPGEPGDGAFLYAWVAVTDDDVGIMAVDIGLGGPTPLVMQRRDLAEKMRKTLAAIPLPPGKTIQLRRYAMAEVLDKL